MSDVTTQAPLAPTGEDEPGFALNTVDGAIFNLTDENRNQVFNALKSAPAGGESRDELRTLLVRDARRRRLLRLFRTAGVTSYATCDAAFGF